MQCFNIKTHYCQCLLLKWNQIDVCVLQTLKAPSCETARRKVWNWEFDLLPGSQCPLFKPQKLKLLDGCGKNSIIHRSHGSVSWTARSMERSIFFLLKKSYLSPRWHSYFGWIFKKKEIWFQLTSDTQKNNSLILKEEQYTTRDEKCKNNHDYHGGNISLFNLSNQGSCQNLKRLPFCRWCWCYHHHSSSPTITYRYQLSEKKSCLL